MGAHTPIKEREEIVARSRRSGLTQREFCEAEGWRRSFHLFLEPRDFFSGARNS